MTDDDLLRQLARVAREEEEAERRDPRWEALAAGELAAEEEEALRREAEHSMEAAERYEAFRPLDERFRERMVAAIRAGRGGAAPAAGAARPEGADLRPADGATRPEVAALAVARRRRLARLRWSAVAGLAAAAALLVVVWPRDGGPLPAYEARLAGGVESFRGADGPAPAEPPVFALGNAFELVLTPAEPVAGRLVVRAYVAAAGGELRPLELPVEVSEHGAVRIAGRVGEEVVLPPGAAELVVAVGRPRRLPSPAALAARRGEAAAGEAIAGEGWRAWSLPVVFRESP